MGDIKKLLRKAGKEPKTAEVEIDGELFKFKGRPDTRFWIEIHNPSKEARDETIAQWKLAIKHVWGQDVDFTHDDVWRIQAVARFSDPPMEELDVAMLSATSGESFLPMFACVMTMVMGGVESAELGTQLIDEAIVGNSAASTDQGSSLKSGRSRRQASQSNGSRQRVGQIAKLPAS